MRECNNEKQMLIIVIWFLFGGNQFSLAKTQLGTSTAAWSLSESGAKFRQTYKCVTKGKVAKAVRTEDSGI